MRTEYHRGRELLLSVALDRVAQVDEAALHVLVDHRLSVLVYALELNLVAMCEESSIWLARRTDLLAGQNVDQLPSLVRTRLGVVRESWRKGLHCQRIYGLNA